LGGNQRIAFLSLSGLASESTLGLEDIDDANYESRITSGVTQFNATTDPDGLFTTLQALDDDLSLNLDLGWAKQIDDQLTLGLTVKNLIPTEFRTGSGRSVDLKPQLRFGAAYRSRWGDFAADLDLIENDPLLKGDPVQELGLGGEWTFGQQQVRAGLVKNLAGDAGSASLIYTFGFRLRYGAFYSDLTYGSGKDHKAAAWQLGLHF
jgi:hypothetical protein